MAYVFRIDDIDAATAQWRNLEISRTADTMADDNVTGWLMRGVTGYFDDYYIADHGDAFYSTLYTRALRRYLNLWELSFSQDDGRLQLGYWPDCKMYAANRRFKGKPGKVLRKIFPGIDDVTLQKLVDSYQAQFDVSQYEYGVAKTREEIVDVFSTPNAEFQNPATTFYRKSLSSSCMRSAKSNGDYVFSHTHPAQAYGSGDFEVHYLKTADNRLAGRVVVNISKAGEKCDATHAPVYGVSELSLNLLAAKMSAIGARQAKDCDWEGATIFAEEYRGSLIAPYLDIAPQRYSWDMKTDKGQISSRGGFTGNQYHGVQYDESGTCFHCEEHFSRNDMTQHDGEHYCEDCFSEQFTYCESCGETIDREDAQYADCDAYCEGCYSRRFTQCECCEEDVSNDCIASVYYLRRDGRTRSAEWCENCRDDAAHLCSDSEYWRADDCQWSEYESEYISPNDIGDYFVSDDDGELYPLSQLAETDSGERISIDAAEDRGLELRDSVWVDPDAIAAAPVEPDAIALAAWDDDGGCNAAQFYSRAMQLPCIGLLPQSRDACAYDGSICDGTGYHCRYCLNDNANAPRHSNPRTLITLRGFNSNATR
jgi:hypothetical protein